MTYDEILEQGVALLRRRGRMSYRALKAQFTLDDELLEVLTEELVEVQQVAVDQDGKMLVWTGKGTEEESENRGIGESEKKPTTPSDARLSTLALDARRDAGERRQLTVMFCDVVGSTAL